ncbi:MAG: hypothetical protein HQ559_02435 [Lentisphaerae bacterium]|nr:hypothetical protein [Lentisphaerota bacterium]
MTDFLENTETLMATVAELFRKAGPCPELEVLTSATGEVEEGDRDMDSVYYSLLLSIDADLYARHEEAVTEIEESILAKGRLVVRASPGVWLQRVVITPAPVAGSNWRGKRYRIPSQELLKDLEAQRNTMVSVSTGGARIQSVNADYVERRQAIAEALEERRIDDPNPYSDLWQWYGKWSSDLPGYQSRREFLGDMHNPLIDRIRKECQGGAQRVFDEPTGWSKVDRNIGEIRRRLGDAKTEEQFQAVGFLCREALITLGQVVFNPTEHPSPDGVRPSKTDAGRMLEAFLSVELKGETNEKARKHARAALDLANELTHKRTAQFRLAALCAESTISIINLVAIVSGQRDPAQ